MQDPSLELSVLHPGRAKSPDTQGSSPDTREDERYGSLGNTKVPHLICRTGRLAGCSVTATRIVVEVVPTHIVRFVRVV